MPTDRHTDKTPGLISPGEDAFLITPNDGADLTRVPRALLVGGSGDIKVTTLKGTTLTIPSVPTGILPLRVSRVWATGTTASSLTALD